MFGVFFRYLSQLVATVWLGLYFLFVILPSELIQYLIRKRSVENSKECSQNGFPKKPDGILYLSFVEWFGAFQRPQHLGELLSETHKTLFVNEMRIHRLHTLPVALGEPPHFGHCLADTDGGDSDLRRDLLDRSHGQGGLAGGGMTVGRSPLDPGGPGQDGSHVLVGDRLPSLGGRREGCRELTGRAEAIGGPQGEGARQALLHPSGMPLEP